jgi:hypothetical protein
MKKHAEFDAFIEGFVKECEAHDVDPMVIMKHAFAKEGQFWQGIGQGMFAPAAMGARLRGSNAPILGQSANRKQSLGQMLGLLLGLPSAPLTVPMGMLAGRSPLRNQG